MAFGENLHIRFDSSPHFLHLQLNAKSGLFQVLKFQLADTVL